MLRKEGTSVAVLLVPIVWALAAVAALVTRIPLGLVTNFWAEDGVMFYSEAYNLGGLHVLTIPYVGYLQTFPRLEAGLAVHLPLVYGPLQQEQPEQRQEPLGIRHIAVELEGIRQRHRDGGQDKSYPEGATWRNRLIRKNAPGSASNTSATAEAT